MNIKCKGTNCFAMNGIKHSEECLTEHNKAFSFDPLDTPGNRHPEIRYKGYKGDPLPLDASLDELKAYEEGLRASGRI